MNLVNICPDIPDSWSGGSTAVGRILGGIDRKTVDRYARLGVRNGGIGWKIGKRGKVYSGREVKRLWRLMMGI